MDVAVEVVGADPIEDALGLEHGEDLRLDTRQPQRDALRFGQVDELGELRRTL